MNSMKKRTAAVLTAGILAAALTAPALAVEASPIRIGSYKGNTLQAGDRSGLIIGGTAQTVTSASPEIVAVENVGGCWVAVAKSDGTAVLTATSRSGETASLTLTVGDPAPASGQATSEVPPLASAEELDEVRQEMIRLINQTRRANGAAELPVNDTLMDAAQTISGKLYSWHHSQEESRAVADAGYPYGFGANLTVFTGTGDIAQRAVTNWINSPGHFRTMIDPDYDCIGVGVTVNQGVTYCYMFVGRTDSVNFYA